MGQADLTKCGDPRIASPTVAGHVVEIDSSRIGDRIGNRRIGRVVHIDNDVERTGRPIEYRLPPHHLRPAFAVLGDQYTTRANVIAGKHWISVEILHVVGKIQAKGRVRGTDGFRPPVLAHHQPIGVQEFRPGFCSVLIGIDHCRTGPEGEFGVLTKIVDPGTGEPKDERVGLRLPANALKALPGRAPTQTQLIPRGERVHDVRKSRKPCCSWTYSCVPSRRNCG